MPLVRYAAQRRDYTGSGVLPAWLVGVPINGWVEISGSSLSNASVMGAPNGSNSPQGKQDAWCGWSIDTRTSKVYSRAQGGHDDYHGNEVNVIDLSVDAPAFSQLIAPTSSGSVTSTSLYYSDGKPASQHGYYGEHCIESLDRLLGFPGGAISTSGQASQEVVAFNISSNTLTNSCNHKISEHSTLAMWCGPSTRRPRMSTVGKQTRAS